MAEQDSLRPGKPVEGQERKDDADRSGRYRQNLLDMLLMCGERVLSTAGSAHCIAYR